jgi:hypothetical protein
MDSCRVGIPGFANNRSWHEAADLGCPLFGR